VILSRSRWGSSDGLKNLARDAWNHLDDLLPALFILAMFKAANAAQIKVSINEIEPCIWRRLVLLVHWNLVYLHLGYRPHSTGGIITCMSSALVVGGMETLNSLRRTRPMTMLGCLIRRRFAYWTLSKVPFSATTTTSEMAGEGERLERIRTADTLTNR
jgi:hypothetical protein